MCRRWIFAHWSMIAVSALLLTGCSSMNHTQYGATVGTGIGTVAGAIIGHQSGHGEGGALIGAATGAAAGALLGNAEDARAERDAAFAHADFIEAQQHASMLTKHDLIRMSQSGLSDDVIIATIRQQGGQFHLTPDAIIELHTAGVSNPVITAMQASGPSPGPKFVPVEVPVPVPVYEDPHFMFVGHRHYRPHCRPRRHGSSVTIGAGPVRLHVH